jgi:restriction system protein
MSMTAGDLPAYNDLIYPTLVAVSELGGSAKSREITARVIEDLQVPDEMLEITYGTREREKSVFVDRLDWARSYAKLGGALESPRRALFLLTTKGREILALPEDEARKHILDMDREVRRGRQQRGKQTEPTAEAPKPSDDASTDTESEPWREVLLARLHKLTPTGFEEFVMYLLRTYGLELDRIGGPGDGGIDGIGTAPISPVLSSRVAVQAKRFDPATAVSRDTVALFQRDAGAVGAERAVLVTLGRFTEPARRAATAAIPNVDLIDGQRVCDLALEQEIGIHFAPQVDESWFDRFD